tara:strand:+ start:3077 stop:4372 length:1296 start_codon:yes stop_codon:yes gene_type:complete
MNEYDSDRILEFTKKIGYTKTSDDTRSDCYIINTCHIREKATDKVFHDIGRVKKKYRNKKKPILIITGCVAQAEGELILKKEKYVDAVIGPQSYHEINKIIQNIEHKKKRVDFTEFETVKKFDEITNLKNSNTKVSAFLTIQEGCDKFCKFCVVPYTRGPEFSRPYESIMEEAKRLVINGAKEITLLGQNVNSYSYKKKKISNLISDLAKFKNLKRIRYMTSHPKDMTKDLIEIYKNEKKLMPLLHLPIQSGSNQILNQMNRKHNTNEYIEIINSLKKLNPKIEFTSDFIIAYPGETENDFQSTLALMSKIKFVNSYSFIYSPRPGTPSSNLNLINKKIAVRRLEQFQKLSKQIRENYFKKLLNNKVKVLFENKVKDQNKFFGRDEHYNPVVVETKENLSGKIVNVLIKSFSQNTLFGELDNYKFKNKYAA